MGAKLLARETQVDFTGRTLSRYNIIEKIGEGGAGVVYKARDTHLDRFVAIKILSAEKVADESRRRRFIQEAKAASALNHPNIITVHDISEEGEAFFMVMEWVEGKTLLQLVAHKRLSLSETLRCAVQMADGLAAAHGKGIVHRDLKPGNVMVTAAGLVKVLDFGLAKLSEAPPCSSGTETSGGMGASKEPLTGQGMIVGTVAYMSPEQAEGKPVDARSDIFSVGSVLYEMLTGRRAFSGDTNASTVAAILREDPKPVSQVALEVPRELDRVISRCLRKNPERRFQHMVDLKVALEELKEESDSGTLTPTGLPATRRRRWPVWAAATFLMAATLGIAGWFGLFRHPAAKAVATVSVFTAPPGVAGGPALSPDGKQVAFVWSAKNEDNPHVYVQLEGDAPRRLTNNAAFEYSPVWSPDALRIAFLRDTPGGTEVITIPAAGGMEHRLHVSAAVCRWASTKMFSKQYCGLAWSPDGKFLSIVDKELPEGPNSIFLFDIQTREKRKLTTPPTGGYNDGLSAFSPDGRSLAFARCIALCDIYVLTVSDSGQPHGEPHRLTRDNAFILGLDWAEDGRSIVFASSRGGVSALWRVAASGGEPERLPVGGSNAFWPSISRTGNRLAYSEGSVDVNVWRVGAPGGGVTDAAAAAPMRITQSPLWDQEPAFSPDGKKIAWSSTQSGSNQVWVCESDGSHPIPLTDFGPPGAAEPQWSPDGGQIAFLGYSRGPTQVYVIGAEGGKPHRLTTGDLMAGPTGQPGWSRDGKWIYFVSNRGGEAAVWKVAASGGTPLPVSAQGRMPVESMDGRFVYCIGPGASLWKIPTGGGSPVLVAQKADWPFFESIDGRFVYYSGPDASIWKTSAAGGEAAPVLEIAKRALWTLSAAGIYVLDPDAEGGPAIELFPFANRRTEVLRLPGEADSYAFEALSMSSDGRWILYMHRDRNDAAIMLVKDFR